MAGIYIHIPFCRKACHYCNFHFSTSLSLKNGFLKALLNEMTLRHQYLEGAPVQTIYFGGGTPSLLEPAELDAIFQHVRTLFTIGEQAEITLEANPDDISPEKLMAWQKAGINRLSLGIQSFFEEDLRWMNRAHSAEQAQNALTLALSYFPNLTIDLIYGTPGLTNEKWKQNVDLVLQTGVPHISCYALTVEPRTALQKMIADHKKQDIDPDLQAVQFQLLMDWMNEAGYEHYEISNFARKGFRSRHNSSYWEGVPYLGLGPSAHSFNGSGRQWNISNNALYISSLEKNNWQPGSEELSTADQFNEFVMTQLRRMEGISKEQLVKRFGADKPEWVRKAGSKFLQSNLLSETNTSFMLTKEGKLFADGIAADLFIDNTSANDAAGI